MTEFERGSGSNLHEGGATRFFRGRLPSRFCEKMEFYKGWMRNPKRVGAIAPTSSAMARRIASIVRSDSRAPVLELGPGNGVITKAILEQGIKPEELISVEYSKSFLPGLRRRYPGVNFVHSDAFNISQIAKELGIEKFDTIISALPLLTFPVSHRIQLVETMLDLLKPGRPMVQFSYMPGSPIPSRSKLYVVNHMATVMQNLPPARLWTIQHCRESAERKRV